MTINNRLYVTKIKNLVEIVVGNCFLCHGEKSIVVLGYLTKCA